MVKTLAQYKKILTWKKKEKKKKLTSFENSDFYFFFFTLNPITKGKQNIAELGANTDANRTCSNLF